MEGVAIPVCAGNTGDTSCNLFSFTIFCDREWIVKNFFPLFKKIVGEKYGLKEHRKDALFYNLKKVFTELCSLHIFQIYYNKNKIILKVGHKYY